MDGLEDDLPNNCIICQETNLKKKTLVKKQPEANEATKSLLEHCQELKNNTVTPLLQRLSQAQEAQILETVRYHSECLKKIMHDKRKRYY